SFLWQPASGAREVRERVFGHIALRPARAPLKRAQKLLCNLCFHVSAKRQRSRGGGGSRETEKTDHSLDSRGTTAPLSEQTTSPRGWAGRTVIANFRGSLRRDRGRRHHARYRRQGPFRQSDR